MRALLLLLAVPTLAFADPPTVTRTWPQEWPLDPAPIVSETWPTLPAIEDGEPATERAARVMERLRFIQSTQRDAAYQHRTEVRESIARYRWDCSGMVSWIVEHTAPRASHELGAPRVIARRVHDTIERASTDVPARRGWQRIENIEDVRPGDVFAWRRPPGDPSPHSGHTGFIVSRPVRVPGIRGGYAIRIADSIIGPHQDDTRPPDTAGSLGFGTVVFLADENGHPTHFGWHGTRTLGYLRAPITFGRLWR